jgi:membrane associated rhomboid family serine protease
MRFIAIFAFALAFVAALVWLVKSPGYDSAAALFAAFAALVASYFLNRDAATQQQNVSKSSVGVQAGRDANVNNIKNK